MKHFSYCKYIVSVILEATILFVSVQISLLVGFLLGKSRNSRVTHQIDSVQPEKSFLSQSKQASTKKEVKIDNSTFVTKTNESQLKGTGEELGSQTIVSDDVSSSVSKLAQLKRNK
jgi:hypothetical protein